MILYFMILFFHIMATSLCITIGIVLQLLTLNKCIYFVDIFKANLSIEFEKKMYSGHFKESVFLIIIKFFTLTEFGRVFLC